MTVPTTNLSPDGPLSVLHFMRNLWDQEANSPLNTVLTNLAACFQASSAGVVLDIWQQRVGTNAGVPLPWETEAHLQEQLWQCPSALTRERDGRRWLACGICVFEEPGLVFLEDPATRTWTSLEISLFVSVAQALARWMMHQNQPPWTLALQRARQQRHLEQAAKVTARLAHDMGNVLTGVLGFTELTLSQLPPNSQHARYLSEVSSAARFGADWVQKLQMFCRRGAANKQPAQIPAVLAEAKQRFASTWGTKFSLELKNATVLSPVAVDAPSVKLILDQLLDNAAEASPEGSSIVVTVGPRELNEQQCRELLGNAQRGGFVEIAVTDRGRGFPPEMRQHLFREMFVSTKGKRRGLGLPMIYGLVHAYGGGLGFDPHPAHGAEVRVLLPLAKTSLGGPAPGVPDSLPAGIKRP